MRKDNPKIIEKGIQLNNISYFQNTLNLSSNNPHGNDCA